MFDKREAQAETKKVPPRNDLKESPLRRNSKALELQNRDPNFVYEFKSVDEHHPHCVDKNGRLEEHEYGNQAGGFVTIKGWQPVHRQTDPNLRPAEARSDQGKPIDTLVRYGRQILCRMPKEEHAKYALADQSYQDSIQRQIFTPDRMGDGNARMTAVVSDDPNADKLQMLRNSGHPIPGIS